MLYAGGSRSEKQVAEKAMPMGAHGNKVAPLLLDPPHDLGYRIAIGQLDFGFDTFGCELRVDLREVRRVLLDFAADRVRPVPSSATCRRTTRLSMSLASGFIWSRIARSVGVASRVIRIFLYMLASGKSARSQPSIYPPVMTCHAVLIESGRP
jgi:hypothetical protein